MFTCIRRLPKFRTNLTLSRRCHPKKPSTIQYQTLETITDHPQFVSKPLQSNSTLSQTLLKLVEQKTLGLNLRSLNSFDNELSRKITSESTLTDVLSTMHCCALISQTGAIRLTTFKKCLKYLDSFYSCSDSNIFQKIQSLYYASFYRDSSPSQLFIRKLSKKLTVDDLKPLGLFELSLLCTALFSSSVPIQNSQILSLIENKVLGDPSVLENSPVLVSIVKALRISNYHSQELCNALAQNPQALDPTHHSLVGRIHLSVYLASCCYANKSFVNNIVTSCVRDSSRQYLRLKDIHYLSWIVATYCDRDINDSVSRSTLPEQVSRVIADERLCDFPMVVTLILHLWIAGVRLTKEVKEHLTERNVRRLKDKGFFKNVSNLNLLLSCVDIEAPHLLDFKASDYQDNRLAPKFDKHMSLRPEFRRVWFALRNSGNRLGLEDIRFSYQIPGLYIAGFTATYKKKLINIEVLDSHVCLTNSSYLNGRMILKLRLLEKFGNKIIQIPPRLSTDSLEASIMKGFQGNDS